ncbi:hypothetical protein BKA70DRAFT_1251565 [Coprinopsis sp. MPI-PUGE-AT-0042]|nr:hypothetical protein BKA70DRAFT_1251565 [Coprinopsis sp. MPI-PUGE-AT-0042]
MRPSLSRNHSTSSPSNKAPRKSSSFLSLRRSKDKGSAAGDLPAPPSREVYGSSATPPTSYVDVHNYPQASGKPRPTTAPSRESSSGKPAIYSAFSTSARPTTATTIKPDAYAFPSVDSTEDLTTTTVLRSSSRQYTRTRSRTGPSGRSEWDGLADVPSLRFSGSSTQHTDTPPRTPNDYYESTDSLEQLRFPSLVAVPIAGVATMDALVDGMNGGNDDVLSSYGLPSRSRYGIPNHHPLYQPPLPTPPPGVVLSAGTKNRKHRKVRKPAISNSSSEDDSPVHTPTAPTSSRRRRNEPSHRSSSNASKSTSNPLSSPPLTANASSSLASPRPGTSTERYRTRPSTSPDARKSLVPSISEIIRTHAPAEVQAKMSFRSSSVYAQSQEHATVHEEGETEQELIDPAGEGEFVSRSSIDSVADEVQRTLRLVQKPAPSKPPMPPPPSSFLRRQSTFSDSHSLYSPRSDPGATASLYSSSTASIYQAHSPVDLNFLSMVKPSSGNQDIAQYLRSARLTTLLKLIRQPHASPEDPLTVSLSDLGSPNGIPVVVFLGLGCVRHLMGLYDEMAECLGLRLITIDRWGLGRTDARPKASKGIFQWASVVEEVLDLLGIRECCIMAHSAGAPYALSFANKVPSRVRGDICLLAPWVGGSENSGYRWLKYVPNGILRTAQAAEWKLQAWMIGKPPTIAYEGIGYTAPRKESSSRVASVPNTRSPSPKGVPPPGTTSTSRSEALPRPSMASSNFSEYDDLRDFDGKFDSRSTLGADASRADSMQAGGPLAGKRKTSRGFLNRLKGNGSNRPEEKQENKSIGPAKKLKGLRSMGSLKGKSRKSEPSSPQLPPSLRIEVGLGLDNGWSHRLDIDAASIQASLPATPSPSTANDSQPFRSQGHRSLSFTSSKPPSLPSSPSPSSFTASYAPSTSSVNYQAALGNALIAASHAESAKGTHNDLLQILNHDNQPWGFSYAAYPHNVRVWYGDRDEKIAENAVRWMERTMGNERCAVKVVKGADHGLMYRSSVVVEVLECLQDAWKGESLESFHR